VGDCILDDAEYYPEREETIMKSDQPPLLMRAYSALFHALPLLKSGLTPLAFNFATNRQFSRSNRHIVAKMLNGIKISVPPNDYHGRILYLFGTNDPKVQIAARHLLRHGDIFLDIGANFSTIGLSVADKIGAAGLVHLFEPQASICESVETAIAEAKLENVKLHRVALMDRDGEMTISGPRDHSGMATLVDYGGDRNGWCSQIVQVRDVASYVSPLIAKKPFGAKIDVEGAEKYIMPWLLQQPNLRFLLFEAAHEQNELLHLVRSAGFSLYGLCRSPFRSRIRVVETIEEMSRYHDMLAIRLPGDLKSLRITSPRQIGRRLRLMGL
jgi:FkbM family methyltransferase